MNKKNIRLIGIASIALLTVAGVGLVGLPIVTQTQTWSAEIEQSEASNEQLGTQLAGLENTKTQLDNIQAINDELALRFPNLPNGTDLLQNISSAASLAGIGSGGIENIAISAPTLIVDTAAAEAAPVAAEPVEGEATAEAAPVVEAPASNVASMEISLSIKATPDQILGFSREFNNMSRTIKIKTAAISGGGEDGVSTFALTGVAYLYASIVAPVSEEPVAEEVPTTDDETITEDGTSGETEFEEF